MLWPFSKGQSIGLISEQLRFISTIGYSLDSQPIEMSTEKEKMLRGELYHAFVPDLIAARSRCKQACNRFGPEDVSSSSG